MPVSSVPPVVSESVRVAALPEVVWAMVSDVTRMGEWSPETTSCRWLGGATGPEVGARFVGVNRYRWRRWPTWCRVTEAMPGESFAFDVSVAGLSISRWRYGLRPVAGGCEVTESMTDTRRPLVKRLALLATGIEDRASHNRASMRVTLAALAAAAAAAPRP